MNIYIFKALHGLSKEDAILFGCVLCSIWKQRINKVLNEEIDAQAYVS